MNVTVNGQMRELPPAASIEELLQLLQMDPARVAVEHNRSILPKSRFAATVLVDGDMVEIVQFVGGG
jgi:thiamine biosynthesis protein ThiS